jgi:hypothetical protein
MRHKTLVEGQVVEYSRLCTGGGRGERRRWTAGYVVVEPVSSKNPSCAVIRKIRPAGLLERMSIFARFPEIRVSR